MTPVRGRRGRYVHVQMTSAETPNVLCGARIRFLIVEPDAPITCPRCIDAATFN